MSVEWKSYDSGGAWDELIGPGGRPRVPARELCRYLRSLSDEELAAHKDAAELTILLMGITFTVYDEGGGSIDRAWPFDVVPRIIARKEWERTEQGLIQRTRALNLFINDLYHDQEIVKDGVFPAVLLEDSKNFRPQCIGIDPPQGTWAHICGSDLVRDANGTLYVLEDNLRVPSGVSYMLENRQVMKRTFPELFGQQAILPVDDYPAQLYDMLASMSPRQVKFPNVVVMTPGIYNSAYFEHSYLAQQMGCQLVEGSDMVVGDDDCLYLKTIDGLERVDVVYRRIDDMFLDPEAFRPDSTLGVPGLMRAWRAGNVALANAPGAGVADDKVVYSFVPEIIRYYLNEDAILPNVPTWRCMEPDHLEHVLANLADLVVKPANESGGYGMLIGPQSTKKQRDEFKAAIRKDPRNYIAQPTLTLSTTPTLVDGAFEPRHVDLRPFILSGDNPYVTTGGLTRVALRKGSLVVNSSQGGGSKDTWIVDTES